MDSNDLEDRLIQFSVDIIQLTEKLPKTRAGNHLANQLIRSGTSPALNYGEARSAESKKDFIHKLGLVLKELRESKINIKIIIESELCSQKETIREVLKECDELIAIVYSSIKSAKARKQ